MPSRCRTTGESPPRPRAAARRRRAWLAAPRGAGSDRSPAVVITSATTAARSGIDDRRSESPAVTIPASVKASSTSSSRSERPKASMASPVRSVPSSRDRNDVDRVAARRLGDPPGQRYARPSTNSATASPQLSGCPIDGRRRVVEFVRQTRRQRAELRHPLALGQQ